MALFGSWPTRTETALDEREVVVRAVLRRVVCHVEATGPTSPEGPGPGAIPPVWLERASVVALLGGVELTIHEWLAEPASVSLTVVFGDVTVRVPSGTRVCLDLKTAGGRIRDDRPGSAPAAAEDGTVHVILTGHVAFGRFRIAEYDPAEPPRVIDPSAGDA